LAKPRRLRSLARGRIESAHPEDFAEQMVAELPAGRQPLALGEILDRAAGLFVRRFGRWSRF